jgi:hypothetical protein
MPLGGCGVHPRGAGRQRREIRRDGTGTGLRSGGHFRQTATVIETRHVPDGSPLAGVHLTVNLNSQTIDIYLGPADFLSQFEISFVKSDRVHIVGSRVKFRGAPCVLAREIRKEYTTVYLRDRRGIPYWRKSAT